jgi:glycosyltransferase involved in cell wall biosynthesis
VTDAPEISFCLPVFNATGAIERCLKAILAQTVPSREILVVDNCSTDDTVAKARAILQDVPNARVVVNDKNLGRIENWNRCLELAKGRYLRFAMVNDVWLPGSAELLLNVAHAHPEAVMICSRARFVTEVVSNPEPMSTNPSIQIFKPIELLKHFCAESKNDTDSLNTILFQTKVIRDNRLSFRTDIPFWSDFYFVIQMSAHGPVVYVNAQTYLFDLGVKGRFANVGAKVLPYYFEVRACSMLIAKLLAEHGEPEWEGYGFLFYQYVNHQHHFGNAPLPGYRDTRALFKGTGQFRRQALKHRLRWGLRHWFKRDAV